MLSFRHLTIVVLTALTLVSCRRDPVTAKKHYVESGNSYYDHGQYKAALIQYQNAIKIDPKFGLARYKLGLVYIKLKPPLVAQAVQELQRAVTLLKDDQAYQEEYKMSLSELYLVFAPKDQHFQEEVENNCATLFKKDPNSFDAFRMTGDLNYVRAIQASEDDKNLPRADELYAAAMENYRKADAIKPNETAVILQIAIVLREQKRYLEAEPYFRRVIDKEKTAFFAYMNFYRTYMIEGKTSEAEQLLKEAVKNNPTTADYLERLAYHYGALGRHDDMVAVLEQIKSHAKEWDAVYGVVGDFYLRTGDTESALREYREGIAKDAKRKSSYQHAVIEVLLRQGKRAEAAEVNSQILKENPKDPDAKSLAATFLLDQGDVNTALAELQSVVTSAPDNAVAHYQLGRAYLASGKSDARESARQQFERAISLRSDMLTPRLGLAELQVLHGEYQGALDTVQEILKRDPGNINARLIQSQAYLGQKKYGDSDTLLDGMMKSNPSSPDVFYQQGVSLMTQGKAKEAEAAFMRAYELNPANPKGLLGVVEADIQQGKPEAAMALLMAESKKAPNRLDIPLLLGTTAQKEGKYSEAVGYFNKVLNGLDKKNKARSDLYLQIAETYRLQGDRNASIANLQKAREITPESETVLSSLGLVLDQAGEKSDARKAYEACLRVNPNNPVVLNNLAYLMAETNADLDMALNHAQKAKGLLPNLPEISDTLGWILLKKALPDQAIPVFKDLVMKAPGNSTYHFHLAMAYHQKGDAAQAAAELREALKHSPPKEELQQIQEMQSRLGGK
jgi:tetratricopeptide (TPR) repeat protein